MPATPVGIPDSAAGAGVVEMLTLDSPVGLPGSVLASKIQPVDTFPAGDPFNWVLRPPTITPVILSPTLAPPVIAAARIPDGEVIVVDAAWIINMAAAGTALRVVRRWAVYHHNMAAVPAAAAAPAVAVAAQADNAGGATPGMNNDALTRSYKIAAVDASGREGNLSAASAAIATTAGNRAVTVTLPALPAGAVAWNVYRTAGGNAAAGPWVQVDQEVTTSYLDLRPDAHLSSITHSLTWDNLPHTQLAPEIGELVWEVFTAVTAAPTRYTYVNDNSRNEQVTIAPGIAVGTRYRLPFRGENRGHAPAPAAAPTHMPGDQKFSEFGGRGVAGFNTAATAIGGQVIVWCEVEVGITPFLTAPVAGSINRVEFPRSAVFPPGSELALQMVNPAAAVAGVREYRVQGRSFTFPTT